MGYILTAEPHSDEASRAFDALDNAFGTDSFEKEEALRVLAEHGFTAVMFTSLVSTGCVTEE